MAYLEMHDITKIYGNGVLANNKVNFEMEKGEIHAIAGENGAGKSTIMKILYGLERADSGEIYINNKKVSIISPNDALKYGIGMVHQHFMLVDSLTVYENIFLGIEIKKGLKLDKNAMIEKTNKLANKFKMKVNPLDIVGEVPVGVKQKVEILKVLARGARLIILDEPTAVLTPIEIEEFFNQLLLLKADGCAICIITHKLKEIKQICDRVTIMQHGEDKGVYNVADITEQEISRLMVGKDVQLSIEKKPANPNNIILDVKNLFVKNENGKSVVNNVSFNVKTGEIVCFAGVEGNGQRETIQSITGLNKKYQGNISIKGTNIKKLNIRKIRDLGLSHIPEDRMTFGTNPNADILDNLISYKVTQKENTSLGFIKFRKLKNRANNLIKDYRILCDSSRQKINMLSGGNMQKVVVAREMDNDPTLLVADQPTRGIDVGAIEFIHKKLVELRDEGKAILLVSADLGEVFNLADKILVFNSGEITGCFTNIRDLSDIEIGEYMLGIKKMSKEEIRRVNNG